jgi:hypothetical protein
MLFVYPYADYPDLHQARFARPADDSKIQRPAKKIRKDGDDIYLHKTKTF